MSPRHVSKQMFSPYFQSTHYRTESKEIQMQRNIEKKVLWFVTIPIRVLRSLFKSRRPRQK